MSDIAKTLRSNASFLLRKGWRTSADLECGAADEIERLRAELEAANKDAARLDWLDSQAENQTIWDGNAQHDPEFTGVRWVLEVQQLGDIRSAIDAAMKEPT